MARPTKKGIDYFSFDVDFFEDEKIEPISGEFGAKGEIIVIRLLCAVYRNGYFAMWTEQLKMTLANRCKVSHDLVEQVVKRLVKWNFFDENLFYSAGILTSRGIQTRFKEATRKRKINYEELEYWLIFDKNRVSSAENPSQQEFTPPLTTQSKVNKSNSINTSISIEDIYTKKDDFEIHNSENPDLQIEKEKRKKVAPKKEKGFSKKDFKNRLLELGALECHIEDWFKARISKRAQFTETALNAFVNECQKNNFPVAEAVKICAERSWQGFKYQWILNEQQSNGTSQYTPSSFASQGTKQPYFFDRERAMQALTGQVTGGLSEN